MAKSYNISFNLLGNLDPSLLAALQKAQNSVKALGNLNGKTLAAAQKLASDKNLQAQIAQYRELQQAARATGIARTQELLNAAQANSKRTVETKKLDNMRAAYQQLQRTQQRLKDESQLRRNELDLARATLKNAKKTGDINAIKAAQEALRAAQIAAKDAAKAVRDINTAARQGKADLKSQENAVKNLGNNFAQASAKAQQLQQQLHQQQQALAQLRTTLPAGNLAHQEELLRSQIQQTTNALNQEIAALERRNQIQANFSQAQQDLSNAYSNFQNAVDTARTIMTPFKDAADNAMTFEKAMSKVKALTSMQNIRDGNLKQVEEDMAALTAQAEQLGAATEFTSTEIADAMKYYGYAGWNAKQILAAMPSTVNMASIADMPIGRVADMFTDDMTIMGIKAGEQIQLANGQLVDAVSHFNDAYAFAITKANMDMTALHTSLTYNAPAMRLAGLSQGDIFAANMIAANAGLKGSVSGTAFRTGVIRMMAPAKKGAEALEELGMSSSEAQKEMAAAGAEMEKLGLTAQSSVTEKILAMKQAWDANELLGDEGAARNAAMLNNIIGKNAFSTWANLFKDNNLGQMLEWSRQIDSGEIEGWSADTADVMRDNTQTSIDYLKSALDALERSAGQALLPSIRSAAEAFTPLVANAAKWVAEHPQVVQACAAIATAVAAATVAVAGFSLVMAGIRFTQAGFATAGLMAESLKLKAQSLVTTLRGLTFANIGASLSGGLTAAATAARAFGAAMLTASRAALMFVFTPVGAALTAIALAAYYAYTHWERVGPAIEKVMNTLSGLLAPVEGLKQALGNIKFDGITSSAGSLIDTIGGGLCGAFIALVGVAGTAIVAIVNLFADLIKTITDVSNNLTNLFDAIGDADFTAAAFCLTKLAFDFGKDMDNIGANFVNTISEGLKGTDAALQSYMNYQPPTPTLAQTIFEAMNASFPQASINSEAGLNALDTSAAQANMDALGTSAQNASTNLDAVNQAGQMAQQAGTLFQTSGTSAQQASEMAQQAGTQFQTAGEAALSAVGSMQALSDGASAVAGALAAKAAEIGSITIPQPQLQVVTLTQTATHNARGGIYPKGEFLTTFAENSAEAAIPLDKSVRAINLWTQAGQILGVLPNQKKTALPSLPSFTQADSNRDFTFANDSSNIIIHVHMNINVSGNADKDSVEKVWSESIPALKRSLAEELAALRHEERRRSFL